VIRYPSQAPALLMGFPPAPNGPPIRTRWCSTLIEAGRLSFRRKGAPPSSGRWSTEQEAVCVRRPTVYFGLGGMDIGPFRGRVSPLKLNPGVEDPARAEKRPLWAEPLGANRRPSAISSDRGSWISARKKPGAQAQLPAGALSTHQTERAHTIGQNGDSCWEAWRSMLDLPDRLRVDHTGRRDVQRVAQKTFAPPTGGTWSPLFFFFPGRGSRRDPPKTLQLPPLQIEKLPSGPHELAGGAEEGIAALSTCGSRCRQGALRGNPPWQGPGWQQFTPWDLLRRGNPAAPPRRERGPR